MGSGVSILTNESIVFDHLEQKYKEDPIKTTQLVNKCNKKLKKLRRNPSNFLPPSEQEIVQKFKDMDFNGNNIISLAEIDKYISEKYPIFDNKPALMRSYKAADTNNNGFISLKEFKNLWKYIVYFNKLWEKFDEIDVNSDKRINFKEFKVMSNSLFESKLNDKEAVYYFELIDKDNAGMILFNEFCAFMIKRKIALE
jgi:Ca2+-binding EF-hand superfamily protein